jgi:uncharacterized protein (TIGR03437 family)
MTCRGAACLLLLSAVSGFALESPRAYNAASGGVAISPGSIVELAYLDGPDVSDARLVTVSVQPEGSTQVFACLVLTAGLDRVWTVLPVEVPPGAARITLAINGEVFPSTPVTLAVSAPALFSVNQFSGGAGALAQNLDSLGAPSLNRLTNPALAGEYVTLWGTGLGNLTTGDVTVELAGEPIPAYFAGHSPGLPGMDQVNFRIPADAFDGCYVPVILRAAGIVSNPVTIAKASAAGACTHPLGLSASDLKTLDDGGSISFGSVSISGGITVPLDPTDRGYYRYDSVIGRFGQLSAPDIALLAQPQSPDPGYPACQIASGARYGISVGFFIGGGGRAGRLLLTGPAGQQLAVIGYDGQYFGGTGPAGSANSPDQLPPPFFSAGTWLLSVTGDTVVNGFQQALQLPPELTWTNRASLTTISRASDTAITWDPAGYSATDIAYITLTGGGLSEVGCLARATSGGVTLGRSLLGQLAPTSDGLLSVNISNDLRDRQPFNVPLKAGGTMPVVFGYGFGETLRVVVK